MRSVEDMFAFGQAALFEKVETPTDVTGRVTTAQFFGVVPIQNRIDFFRATGGTAARITLGIPADDLKAAEDAQETDGDLRTAGEGGRPVPRLPVLHRPGGGGDGPPPGRGGKGAPSLRGPGSDAPRRVPGEFRGPHRRSDRRGGRPGGGSRFRRGGPPALRPGPRGEDRRALRGGEDRRDSSWGSSGCCRSWSRSSGRSRISASTSRSITPSRLRADGRLHLDIEYAVSARQKGLFVPLGKPVALSDNSAPAHAFIFPLKGWNPGEYLLTVTVTDRVTLQVRAGNAPFLVQ